ncbi:PQQ-binding-like beta-propeller repeat protein [Streptomyces sp. NRRL F-5727]|uniref:outer membrane protein assembly factor BamB family protein n=1 Tax=Streptomyces sp. NRRL F-5727 TaxID=1463871 RepID=UPI0004C4AAE6|nr:PQQ-binding-like beta-propeller repeat protein [Streptomyces sp. NRRL F-5727]
MTTATKAGRTAGGKPGGGGGKGTGDRDGGTPKPGSRLVRYSVVGGLLLAVLAGCGGITAGVLAGEGYLPGDSMRQVWSTPTDGGTPASGDAAWAAGDTLVHSNAAGVTGFDARTGERRWRYEPAGGAAICSAGRTAADGVALIAQGVPGLPGSPAADDADEGCTTVVALDLTAGRELWRTTRTAADGGEIRAERDLVAVGGGLAVLRDEDADWQYASALDSPGRLDPDRALRAFDLRTGKPRWSARMPRDCVPYGVAAGDRRVAALLVCDRRDVRLAVLDPADGRVRGVTPLDPRRVVDPLTHAPAFVSADPIVVGVDSLDETGYATFLSFDDEGRAQGTIASGTVNGKISSAAQEPARTRVAYGRLYTVAMESDYDDVVTAFDLRSGQRLWRMEVGDLEDVMGLRVAGGRVTALVDLYGSAGEDGLLVLDADDGDERDARLFPDSVGGSSGEIKDVLGHQDRLIAVRWSEGYLSPFTAYEER